MKRRSARQQFVKDRSQTVHVASRSNWARSAAGLFGGHVARRPNRGSGPGETAFPLQPAGKSEVADLGGTGGGGERCRA